jgi:hypothetical protein
MDNWFAFFRGPKAQLMVALCVLAIPHAALGSTTIAKALEFSNKIVGLTVLLHGQPATNAVVEIFADNAYDTFRSTARPRFLLRTDNAGRVLTPTLAPGQYEIIARVEPDFRDNLTVYVSADSSDNIPSEYCLVLKPDGYYGPTFLQLLEETEQGTVSRRTSKLSGAIEDTMGHSVPDASIVVFRKGTDGREPVLQTKADAQAKFSADLIDGDYVVFVTAVGYPRFATLVTITKTASGDPIEIKLRFIPSTSYTE